MNRGYESYFRRSQQVDYIEHYVNYGLLKAKLNDFYTRRRDLLRALSNGKGQLGIEDFDKLCGRSDTNNNNNNTNNGRAGGGVAFFPSTTNANTSVAINTANSFVTDDALLDNGGNGCEYFLPNNDDNGGMYYGCSASPSSNYHTSTTNNTTNKKSRRRSKFINGPTAIHRLSTMERNEFDSLLQIELHRAAMYYMYTLLPCVQQHVIKKDYTTASQLLLEVVAFAITNIITYRQLIIRYDAFCWTFDVVVTTPSVLVRPMIHHHTKWEEEANTNFSSSLPVVGRVVHQWGDELKNTTSTTTVSSSLPVGSSTTTNENEQHLHPVSRMFDLWGINELELNIIVGVQESRTHYMLGEEPTMCMMMDKEQPIIISPTTNNTSTTTLSSNIACSTTTATATTTLMTTDDIDALTTQISSFRCLLEKTERMTILQRSRSSRTSSSSTSSNNAATTTTTATEVYMLRDKLLLFGARIIDYLLIDLQRREYITIYYYLMQLLYYLCIFIYL
jgi:hypothetical protein